MLTLACSAAGLAQDKGYWRALSQTAKGITGDVTITDEKITLNFVPFTMAPIRVLQPAELAAVFPAEDAGGAGSLYRLNVPASTKFLHKNTLCGSEVTQWLATYVKGKDLQLAFLSGGKMPELTPEAMNNSTDLCGTYSYVR